MTGSGGTPMREGLCLGSGQSDWEDTACPDCTCCDRVACVSRPPGCAFSESLGDYTCPVYRTIGTRKGWESPVTLMPSPWRRSWRGDPRAVSVADRHYNRQAPGSPQFVPPGRCVVLLTEHADALWVSSWPFAEYVRHKWAGAWMCSLFRREPECPHLASDLIVRAVAATRSVWEPPPLGMVTFIDPNKTRRKRDPGRCYRRAGWSAIGETKGGLVALQLLPADMPHPEPIIGAQMALDFSEGVA